jgi:hypothetical protein
MPSSRPRALEDISILFDLGDLGLRDLKGGASLGAATRCRSHF